MTRRPSGWQSFGALLLLVGCGGESLSSEERPGAPDESCSDGLLVVDGPVTSIVALYPEASLPDRLRGHSTSPAMFITVQADGWLTFDPYEAVPAASVATIETHDVSTGAALCPLALEVRREP